MRFSIITISFNSENTIERTIKSVLAQTFTDYEYIIVDGASKDGTLDIIKRYEPLFEGKLKWKSEPDTGIYNAMNKGILRSNGDVIGIVNSDDWLEPEALELIERYYIENNRDNNSLYCGDIRFYKTDGGYKEWKTDLNSFKKQARLFYIMSGIRHPAVFVPRYIYETEGLFNEDMHLSADQDFLLRCYFHGKRFVYMKIIVSNMSAGGISTVGSAKSREISRKDRRIMLRSFGKSGISYYWLYYSWYMRGIIRRYAKRWGLYK